MTNQPVLNDMPINILDNNQLMDWIKKWNVYPFEFMEAYHAVTEKTVFKIEEYLSQKGLIQNQ